MRAQAHLTGEVITTQEIAEGRLWTDGPNKNTFYVTGPYVHVEATEREDGTRDFGPVYLAALQALLDAEPRVREGHAFTITVF